MLTEDQVHRSFRNLFSNNDITGDSIEKAENLLEELRPESPLRFRLTNELEELRQLSESEE